MKTIWQGPLTRQNAEEIAKRLRQTLVDKGYIHGSTEFKDGSAKSWLFKSYWQDPVTVKYLENGGVSILLRNEDKLILYTTVEYPTHYPKSTSPAKEIHFAFSDDEVVVTIHQLDGTKDIFIHRFKIKS